MGAIGKPCAPIQLQSASSRPEGDAVQEVFLSFGKHKGKPIKQVDDGYLWWMRATIGSSWWRKQASEELEQRKQLQIPGSKTKTEVRVLLSELKMCSSQKNLERGKQIHAQALESGADSCVYVASALINMYAKCGCMVEARRVFDSIKDPDVVTWNSLILGHANNGELVAALDLFEEMKSRGCAPDPFSFCAALKACTSLAIEQEGRRRAECLERGRLIHSEITFHTNNHVQSALINMYTKCGSTLEARRVFDGMKQPDVVSWNSLILGYVDNGEGRTALDLYASMKSRGCTPNCFTFVAALKACVSLALEQDGSGRAECLEWANQIRSQIGSSSQSNIYVQSTLIDMYAKCGRMLDARRVFDAIRQPNVVSWTALILGYADNGHGVTALQLFGRMKSRGCSPNPMAFVAALKACASLAGDRIESAEWLERGKQIHSEARSCLPNVFVECSLIDLYAKYGRMGEARRAFERMKRPDLASWNTLILGYAENGNGVTALQMFARMKSQGFVPNCITFVAALKAYALLGALESGRKLHEELGSESERQGILVTCLIDFYAKCGSLVEAQRVFDRHPGARDIRTWTALLAGYSRFGDAKAVFRVFEAMQDAGLKPDGVTILCILTCCSHARLLDEAIELFEAMPTRYGILPTVEHYSCMVDVLGRSNKLDDGVDLLQCMPCRPNAVTWMTLLGACRKWRNVGRLAFKNLVSLDDANAASAYLLMAHIYRSRGMLEEEETVLAMSKKLGSAVKESEQSCWTSEVGEVHTFMK